MFINDENNIYIACTFFFFLEEDGEGLCLDTDAFTPRFD